MASKLKYKMPSRFWIGAIKIDIVFKDKKKLKELPPLWGKKIHLTFYLKIFTLSFKKKSYSKFKDDSNGSTFVKFRALFESNLLRFSSSLAPSTGVP